MPAGTPTPTPTTRTPTTESLPYAGPSTGGNDVDERRDHQQLSGSEMAVDGADDGLAAVVKEEASECTESQQRRSQQRRLPILRLNKVPRPRPYATRQRGRSVPTSYTVNVTDDLPSGSGSATSSGPGRIAVKRGRGRPRKTSVERWGSVKAKIARFEQETVHQSPTPTPPPNTSRASAEERKHELYPANTHTVNSRDFA